MKWQEIETRNNRNAFWVINWVNNDSARRAAVLVISCLTCVLQPGDHNASLTFRSGYR